MTLRLTSIFADRLFSHLNHPNARPTMNWKSSTLFILIFGLAALGCDDSDNTSKNNDPIITVPDAGSDGKDIVGDDKDATSPDDKDVKEGDLDAGKDTHSDLDTDTFVENDAIEDGGFVPFDTNRPDTAGPGVSGTCENIEDLGDLALGLQTMTIVFNLDNDNLRTSCRDFNAESKPEKVYKFRVAQQSVLEITGSPSYTFELRNDPCGEESSVVTCNFNGSIIGQALSPSLDYYLVVELEGTIEDFTDAPENSEYFFEFHLQSPFAECRAGQSECTSANEVKICTIDGSYQNKFCPTSCSEGSCVGNTCDNPIVVNSTGTMQGDISTFGNKIASFSSCGTGNGIRNLSGQEVIFLVEEAVVGQTINIDTTGDSLPTVITIQHNNCGALAACDYQSSNTDDQVVYQVQEAGDYYIIIDSTDPVTGNADYRVSIN